SQTESVNGGDLNAPKKLSYITTGDRPLTRVAACGKRRTENPASYARDARAADPGCAGDRSPAWQCAIGRGEGNHRSRRALRPWLRDVYAACGSGRARGGEVPPSLFGRTVRRSDRRSVAGDVQQFLLAQWSCTQQRDQRSRSGPVGHQRPAGGNAG